MCVCVCVRACMRACIRKKVSKWSEGGNDVVWHDVRGWTANIVNIITRDIDMKLLTYICSSSPANGH